MKCHPSVNSTCLKVPSDSGGKNPPSVQETRRGGFDPWDGKIPWRRTWQPTPVFLSGESRGQRSLEGYSPRGHTESDMTERLNMKHAQNPRLLRHIDKDTDVCPDILMSSSAPLPH